jgi:hypothetical protein
MQSLYLSDDDLFSDEKQFLIRQITEMGKESPPAEGVITEPTQSETSLVESSKS